MTTTFSNVISNRNLRSDVDFGRGRSLPVGLSPPPAAAAVLPWSEKACVTVL